MTTNMFCFQCEQTAGGTGCTRNGVCGKTAETANLQDRLTGAFIGLAHAAEGQEHMITTKTDELVMKCLFATFGPIPGGVPICQCVALPGGALPYCPHFHPRS